MLGPAIVAQVMSASSLKWLSPGAIIGYAVGGSVVIFLCLSIGIIFALRARQKFLLSTSKRLIYDPKGSFDRSKRSRLLPMPTEARPEHGSGYSLSDFVERSRGSTRDPDVQSMIEEKGHSSQIENHKYRVSEISDLESADRSSWPLRSQRSLTMPFFLSATKAPLSDTSESSRPRAISTPDLNPIYELPADSEHNLIKLDGVYQHSETEESNETIWPTVAGEISRPKPLGPREKGDNNRNYFQMQQSLSERRNNLAVGKRKKKPDGRSLLKKKMGFEQFVTRSPKLQSWTQRKKSTSNNKANRISRIASAETSCSDAASVIYRPKVSDETRRLGVDSNIDFESPASVPSSQASDWSSPINYENADRGSPPLRGLSSPSFGRGKDDIYYQRLSYNGDKPNLYQGKETEQYASLVASQGPQKGFIKSNEVESHEPPAAQIPCRHSSEIRYSSDDQLQEIMKPAEFRRHKRQPAREQNIRPRNLRKSTFGTSDSSQILLKLQEDSIRGLLENPSMANNPLTQISPEAPKNTVSPSSRGPEVAVRSISGLKSTQNQKPRHRRQKSIRRTSFIPHDLSSSVMPEAKEEDNDSLSSTQRHDVHLHEPETGAKGSAGDKNAVTPIRKRKNSITSQYSSSEYSPTLSVYEYYTSPSRPTSAKEYTPASLCNRSNSDAASIEPPSTPSRIPPKSKSQSSLISKLGTKKAQSGLHPSSLRSSQISTQSDGSYLQDAALQEFLNSASRPWQRPRSNLIGPREPTSEKSVRHSVLALRRMDSEAAHAKKSSRGSELYVKMGNVPNQPAIESELEVDDDESIYETVYADSPYLEEDDWRSRPNVLSKRNSKIVKTGSIAQENSLYDLDGFLKE